MTHLRIRCRADESDKHDTDVNVTLFHKGLLYSGDNDGRIKAWAPDLSRISEVQAHLSAVFSLAASDDTLYSCSDEGTIKAFHLATLKEKSTVIIDDKTEYWKIFFANGFLYSADNMGNVVLWKDNKEYGETNIAEPIKDMAVSGNILYTVKDNDVVITELKLDSVVHDKRLQFGIKKSYMGRFPLSLIENKYLIFASREGKDFTVIENNDETHFRTVGKVDGAHELVINALSGTILNEQTFLFSGGWDKKVKKWKMDEDIIKLDCTCDVDFVINTFSIGANKDIYVGGSDGNLLRIQIE